MREGWTYKKLGEVCTILNGLWVGKKEPLINIAVIRNTNFSKDCKLKLDDVAYIDVEERQFLTRKLQVGDIIIEKSGGSDKQPVGRPVLFNISDGDYSFSNFTATLRLIDESINPKFLHQCLYGYYRNGETKRMQSKTTGLHNLDMKAYLRLPIPCLSISEQQRIVSELDLLSGIIEKKKAQLKEYDQLAQSIFYDMFGDPITNEKGWEVKKLGEVCEVTSSKRIFANEYTSSGIPFYRGKEITEKSKGMPLSIELYISEEMYKELKSIGIPQIGDVLITAVGTIGNIWVVNDNTPFYFKDGNVIWLKNIRMQNSVYFKFILEKLIEIYKQEMVRGAAYNALTIVNLKKMLVFLPPLTLQQQFAEKIEAIEKQKELIKQSITETETLFNSRMDYYFN